MFIFPFDLAGFHSNNFLSFLRRQRGCEGSWLGLLWGQQPLDKQEQDRKAETSQAPLGKPGWGVGQPWRQAALPFPQPWSCCAIVSPALRFFHFPPTPIALATCPEAGHSGSISSVQLQDVFAVFFPELLRLQIWCLHSQTQNNCVPQVWKMPTIFLLSTCKTRERNERDCQWNTQARF